MLPRLAALLSPVAIGTVSAAEVVSRLRLVVSANGAATIAANLALQLVSRFSTLARFAGPIGKRAGLLLLDTALAPLHASLSFLAATYGIVFATLAGLLHLAAHYLLHAL